MIAHQEDTRARVLGPRTIDRAFSVLDCFTFEANRWRTTALAQRCELPVPTVHRILSVLESFRYVSRDPDSREYVLGPSAASLGRRADSAPAALAPALTVMRSLRRATRERVVLASPAGYLGRHLELATDRREEELGDSTAGELVERMAPLHAGASCKVLLAHMPSERIDAVIERGLGHSGHVAITKPTLLRAELVSIRRRGWAASREEVAAGRWSVAVPVLDRTQAPTYAIGISAPLARLESSLACQYLLSLGTAARALATKLTSPTADGAKGPAGQ